ncbi:MAG: TSUP family transporter [Bryobacteraceae bacterium]
MTFVLLGLAAGAVSGLMGMGGNVILVPALVYLFGFFQHRAQGTTVALMCLPIGLLAAVSYFKQGLVDLRVAALIFGLSQGTLRRVFGFFLLAIAVAIIAEK